MSVTVDAPYAPYRDGPRDGFRWRLGLHPLDVRDWIEWGADADAAVEAKRAISDAHHDTVFAVLDDVDAEAQEVADELVAHLRTRWPERFADVGLDRDLHPLDAAARLVPEDLVIMVEREGRLVFGGGSVCFPNRWDLRSKLGSTMTEVHAPVPRLNEQLGAHVDRFLAHLVPGRAYWRLGWGIIDTPDWYAPPVAHREVPSLDRLHLRVEREVPSLDRLHLRVERETLRRFPATGVVLFTIRTYVSTLDGVADRGALAASLDVMPADVREYKELSDVADALSAALVGASHLS